MVVGRDLGPVPSIPFRVRVKYLQGERCLRSDAPALGRGVWTLTHNYQDYGR